MSGNAPAENITSTKRTRQKAVHGIKPTPHPKGQAMSDTKEELKLFAARTMDWQQVALNGGPPCFHLQHGKFCGRAERWAGHEMSEDHAFVSLEQLLTRPPSPALKVAREALEKCKADCSCGAMGCVGHDDTCPVHLKQDALALLAKEGV
jgi:hypothetical protein